MRGSTLVWGLAFVAGSLACADDTGPLPGPCGPAPEWTCLGRAAGPCSVYEGRAPVCGDAGWVCPLGAVRREALEPPERVCRPTFDGLVPGALGPLVPRGDRCWMLVDADVTAGPAGRAPQVVELPEHAVLGSCELGTLTDEAWVDASGLDADDVVDVDDVIATDEGVVAVHRLFELDPNALFGVEAVGASVVRAGDDMPVPKPPHWSTPGYRTLATHSDFVFAFDCFGLPQNLLEDCGVLRAPREAAADPTAYVYLRAFGRYDRVGDRQVVFRAGPQHHVADLGDHLDRWVMVSVAGFGDTVFLQHAARGDVTGWSAPVDIHRCRLPPNDPEAFCDTVRVVTALYDPEQRGELTLTYRVDTLAEDKAERITRDPAAYGPVMVRVQADLPEPDPAVPH